MNIFKGLIKDWIDFCWEKWLFPRNYDPRKTIIVSGTPRGGTTWLAETLAQTPGYLHLFEALAPSHVAVTLAKAPVMLHSWEPLCPFGAYGTPGVGAELYVMPNYLLYQHIQRTIAGQIQFSEYFSLRNALHNLKFVKRLVVKFIRGNLLLYWILKEFDLKGALIIRHPCAVVASQLHQRDVGEMTPDPHWFERIRIYQLPIYEQFDPAFAKVIHSVKTTEELLALEWCIRTIVPLRQPKPHPWFLTTYEGLVEDMKEWEKLCSYLDCPVPSEDAIKRPSSTYQKKGQVGSLGASIEKWRRKLSEKQIDDILRICSEMGVDFYDKTPYPKALDKYRQCSVASLGTPDEQNGSFQQSGNENKSAAEMRK
jgi:hypothetical protein